MWFNENVSNVLYLSKLLDKNVTSSQTENYLDMGDMSIYLSFKIHGYWEVEFHKMRRCVCASFNVISVTLRNISIVRDF